jgi:Clp amino terminal domain, pathogenicity island component
VGGDRGGFDVQLLGRLCIQAEATGSAWLHESHILMALLDPPRPTVAAEALRHAGVDEDRLRAWCEAEGARDRAEHLAEHGAVVTGVSSTAAQQVVVARAHGLAVASGVSVADEHLLLALMYDGGDGFLTEFDVDRGALYEYLGDHGVVVPPLPPPTATPHVRMTQRVYVRFPHASSVLRELARRHPPGAGDGFGVNTDAVPPGWVAFVTSDGIDLATIVASVIPDGEWELGDVDGGG